MAPAPDARAPRWATLLGAALLGFAPTVARAEAPVDPCAIARCSPLNGRVLRRGDRTPIEAARILVVAEAGTRKPGELPRHAHLREDQQPAWVRAATTDAQGRFAVPDVPAGRVRVVVIADGFVRSEHILDTKAKPRPLFLEPLADPAFRTVIAQRSEPLPAAGGVAITAQEIATLPGAQGDALRAVQSLPGVGRAPAGLGLLVLRGAAPAQSRVYYGEHPLPRAFHTLGFTSVLQADVLGGLEVQASNFSPRWGNASGGVVLLAPRKGRRDGVHGFGKIDLLSAGALVEGPLRKGSFMVAAQRGYVDAALRVAERVDPTAAFALPRYYDYQAQYDLERGGNELTVRWIGSGDRYTIRYLEFDGTRRVASDLRDQFHRAEVVLRRRSGPWRLLVTPAFRFDASRSTSDFGDQRRRSYVTSWRAEAERALSRHASVTLGTDAYTAPYRIKTRLDQQFEPSADARGSDANFGTYLWLTLRLGKVTLWPGARASAFVRYSGSDRSRARHRFAIDPRLLARWELGRRWALRAGAGLYAQPDAAFGSGSDNVVSSNQDLGASHVLLPATLRLALDPVVGVGNADPTPDPLQALQGSLGATFTTARGLSLDVTAFGRILDEPRTVVQSRGGFGNDPVFTAETITRNWGAEVLLRQRVGERFYGWIGYTLMFARYGAQDHGLSTRRTFPSAFEQRHNLVVLASYALPRHFRLGARFRVVTGSPYTAVVGTLRRPEGAQPIFGEQNAERFPTFHQLDIRLDRRWYLRRSTIAGYIDVQNVYNHRNVEALVYSDDYREIISSVGLPIFPTLGVRVDW